MVANERVRLPTRNPSSMKSNSKSLFIFHPTLSHDITTPLGRTQSKYARSPTTQETANWRATRRTVLPRCPKEVFPVQFKGLPQDITIDYDPREAEAQGRDMGGEPQSTRTPIDLKPSGPMQQNSAGRKG